MTTTLEKPELSNDSKDGWPSLVDMKVIVPGLVHYEDLKNSKGESVGGNVLVQKPALDRMAASIEGKPIVNWDHRPVNAKEYGRGKFQGIITGPAVFNSADGWYHAKGYVWDEATRRNIENGYSISCAYTVSEWGESGKHNQVPYESEVLNGNYTHIAVVPTPRYEGARIELLNSEGGHMGIMNLFRKDKADEKVEIDLEKTMVPMGEGRSETSLAELINSFKKTQPAAGLKDDDLIEVDGKKVTVLEMKNAHLALLNAKEKDDLENAHKAGDHKNSIANCAMCNSAAEDEKKKKDDEEKKNAADAEEKKKKEDDEKKNSVADAAAKAKADAEKNAAKLEEMRNAGKEVKMPEIKTLRDLEAEGQARYGGPQAAK